MKKIISLFQRNYDTDRLVRDEVTLGAEWVVAGEGVATHKWDGTPVAMINGTWYKRYDVKFDKKTGRGRPVPVGAIACQDPDPVTLHWPHWVLIAIDGGEDQWLRRAIQSTPADTLHPQAFQTYEAIGPKINGGNDHSAMHTLMKHGSTVLLDCPRDFAGLQRYFSETNPHCEGVVWHHPDGRMVKIKRKDFGLPWPPEVAP